MSLQEPTGEWSREDIGRMLELLPLIEQDGFVACEWHGGDKRIVEGKEVITMPYAEYGETLRRFWDLVYGSSAFVDPYVQLPEDRFEGTWDSQAAHRVLGTLEQIGQASLGQIRRYFVLITRTERFCDGFVEGEVTSGRLVAALRRLRELVS